MKIISKVDVISWRLLNLKYKNLSISILQTLQHSFQQPATNLGFMDPDFFFPCSVFVAAKEQFSHFTKPVPLEVWEGTCALRNTKNALQTAMQCLSLGLWTILIFLQDFCKSFIPLERITQSELKRGNMILTWRLVKLHCGYKCCGIPLYL